MWVKPVPTATAVRPAGRETSPPFTGFSAGVSLSPIVVVLPYPSLPLAPSPQQATCPLSSTAQLCTLALLTAITVRSPGIGTPPAWFARSLSPMTEPGEPSWPQALLPQQVSTPSSASAQVVTAPAPSETTRRCTAIGMATADAAVVTSPTRVFTGRLQVWPQQTTRASVRIAQVASVPSVTATTLRLGGCGTMPPFTGFAEGYSSSPIEFVLPYPSRPFEPSPQQLSWPLSSSAHVCW